MQNDFDNFDSNETYAELQPFGNNSQEQTLLDARKSTQNTYNQSRMDSPSRCLDQSTNYYESYSPGHELYQYDLSDRNFHSGGLLGGFDAGYDNSPSHGSCGTPAYSLPDTAFVSSLVQETQSVYGAVDECVANVPVNGTSFDEGCDYDYSSNSRRQQNNGRISLNDMSEAEKYKRVRQQNNKSSKIYRYKKKQQKQSMERELQTLEAQNSVLQKQNELLTVSLDEIRALMAQTTLRSDYM